MRSPAIILPLVAAALFGENGVAGEAHGRHYGGQ
jgi:hypothetical protein